MKPRASRIADIVASVPDDTKRTFSTEVRETISSASSTSGSVGVPYDVPRATAACTASSTSGCAWPSSIGPHEQMRSTYSLPSTSRSQAPWADRMKRGVPPTALNARTGEFTPPGVTAAGPVEELRRSVGLQQGVSGAVSGAHTSIVTEGENTVTSAPEDPGGGWPRPRPGPTFDRPDLGASW